jgi:hypothetical protein
VLVSRHPTRLADDPATPESDIHVIARHLMTIASHPTTLRRDLPVITGSNEAIAWDRIDVAERVPSIASSLQAITDLDEVTTGDPMTRIGPGNVFPRRTMTSSRSEESFACSEMTIGSPDESP